VTVNKLKNKQIVQTGLQNEAVKTALQEERRRISRELHDRVLQLLTSIQLRSELCLTELMGKRDELERELQVIAQAAHNAATEIRSLLLEKQAVADLVAGTLERRLKEEMEIFRARTGLKLNFECAIGRHDLPYETEREIYFALREGIINAIRHSRASEMNLSLTQNDGTCRISLRDNGVGFDRKSATSGGGFGLNGMKERIEKAGGHLEIETGPGKGTHILIEVPIRSRANAKRSQRNSQAVS
jgi:NarL family two-component system sensor histidine kinase LiaS